MFLQSFISRSREWNRMASPNWKSATVLDLLLGLLCFSTMWGHKKITHDPTPIQIEMRKYETDLDTAFINNAERRGHSVDVD